MTELVVAMAILLIAMLPLSYSLWHDRQLSRASYYRAVAMEIVDGEIELLAAARGQDLEPGTRPYPVQAESAKNLPPGSFLLTREGRKLRLEWRPAQKSRGGRVVREVILP